MSEVKCGLTPGGVSVMLPSRRPENGAADQIGDQDEQRDHRQGGQARNAAPTPPSTDRSDTTCAGIGHHCSVGYRRMNLRSTMRLSSL